MDLSLNALWCSIQGHKTSRPPTRTEYISPYEAQMGKGAGQKKPAPDYRNAEKVKQALIIPNGVRHDVVTGLIRREDTGALEPIVVVNIPKKEHLPGEYDWQYFNYGRHAGALSDRKDVEVTPVPLQGKIGDRRVEAKFIMHDVPIVFEEPADRLERSNGRNTPSASGVGKKKR